jgi:hypothetical protein
MKKSMLNAALIVLTVFLVSCASGEKKAQVAENNVQTKQEAVQQPTAGRPGPSSVKEPNETVVVSLGDKKLTLGQIRWAEPKAEGQGIVEFVKNWVEGELQYEEAQRRGITKDPNAVFYADIMAKEAYVMALRKQIAKSINVTEEEIKDYYQKNKTTAANLIKQGTLEFEHVRVKTVQEANDILSKIKSGQAIKDLAEKHSIYRDAKQGGMSNKLNFDYVQNVFGEKFFNALKTADVNNVVGPIQVEDGFEVAKLKSRTETESLPFENVKDKIQKVLYGNKWRQTTQELMDNLKKDAETKMVKSKMLLELEAKKPSGKK